MRTTTYVIVGAAAALIVYDVYAYLTGGVDATISRVLLRAARNNPVIAFAFGVLMGHLFWPQRDRGQDDARGEE